MFRWSEFFLRHVRFKTLAASFNSVTTAYFVTQAAAWKYIICLLVGLSLQALANLFNSYQTDKSCPIKLGVVISLLVALILGLIAVSTRPGLIFFGLVCVALSLGYSAFSRILGARPSETPLADLIVFISFGPLAVFGATYFFEERKFFDYPKYDLLFSLSLICGILAHCLLWIHRIKDIEKDKHLGKKTTSVLLGRRLSLTLLSGELILLSVLGFGIGLLVGAVYVFVSLILFYFLLVRNYYLAFHFFVLFLCLNPFLLLSW